MHHTFKNQAKGLRQRAQTRCIDTCPTFARLRMVSCMKQHTHTHTHMSQSRQTQCKNQQYTIHWVDGKLSQGFLQIFPSWPHMATKWVKCGESQQRTRQLAALNNDDASSVRGPGGQVAEASTYLKAWRSRTTMTNRQRSPFSTMAPLRFLIAGS